MLEQLGNTLTFYAFFVESKVGKTGLSPTVDVWEVAKDGTAAEVATGANATEVGDGLYRYILASATVDAEGEYIAVFKTATATVDQQHIPALWAVGRAGIENLDASIAGVPTTAEFEARTLAAADYFDSAADTVTPAAGSITAAVIATNAITADALNADAVAEIVAGVLAGVVEGTTTVVQAQRLLLSVLGGKSSGGGTAGIAFRDLADSKDRVQATVTAVGDRTAMTLDLT